MSEPAKSLVIEPAWALSQRVRVASTLRCGGGSAAPYDSLNLGLHVGDDEATVRSNRVHLGEHLQLPNSPHWLNQVHGQQVLRLANNPVSDYPARPHPSSGPSSGPSSDPKSGQDTADASWTNLPGAVIAIMTADCLPVVIANQQETAIAVAHAGWRGLVGGVLTSVCDEFAADDKLHAWLGPAIGPTAFEVGEEVLEAFVNRRAVNRSAFIDGAQPGKYLADIYQLARNELASLGDITVTGGDHCTVSEATKFFSHRRDGLRSGRMATLAWLA